jgi:cyclophilin family peptidyl-prolyl cis-trans isomerase
MTSPRRPSSRRVASKARGARPTPRPAIGQIRAGKTVPPPAPRRDSRILVGLAVLAVAAAAFVVVVIKPFGAGSPTGSGGTCPTSQPEPLAAGQTRTVTIETPKGNIVIKVDGSLSPVAAGNFVALASCGFYDGIGFHRIVPDFVIQGGDPEGTGGGGPGYTIADEPITGTYHRGTVAMARTTQPHSQGSQFFIVVSDGAATALNNVDPSRGYAIFGEVSDGMTAVEAIVSAANGVELPTDPVKMTRVTVATP